MLPSQVKHRFGEAEFKKKKKKRKTGHEPVLHVQNERGLVHFGFIFFFT